ncbi:hypothetical protein [Streptomyces cinereoruber]|uniref:hypothetical protein n=1 Tax=Streptomyces cinereoruber TaxID=67260 RepID=UPI00362B9A58
MTLEFLGYRWGQIYRADLLPLRQGEVQPSVNRLYLAPNVQQATPVVDVLRTEPEDLPLAESAPQADYDGDPVPLTDGIADSQCRVHRPRVAPLPWRLGPPHGFRVHGVAREALVVDGRFQDGGKLGQDAALVVD